MLVFNLLFPIPQDGRDVAQVLVFSPAVLVVFELNALIVVPACLLYGPILILYQSTICSVPRSLSVRISDRLRSLVVYPPYS